MAGAEAAGVDDEALDAGAVTLSRPGIDESCKTRVEKSDENESSIYRYCVRIKLSRTICR